MSRSSSYLQGAGSTRRTPQSDPIPGAGQVQDSDGAYVWEIGPLEKLRRFVVLGSEGGSYYASERDLTKQNVAGVRQALDELGPAAVEEVVKISEEGRAPKNNEAIFVIAMACGHSNTEVRKAALAAIPRVCRISTHLFTFLNFVTEFRGHGRALNRAIAEWYLDKPVDKLAYQMVKYRQREGWTHADVLRKVKPGQFDPMPEQHMLFRWATKGRDGLEFGKPAPESLMAYEAAQIARTPAETVMLIKEYGGALPWEALNTDHLKDHAVTEALIVGGMPIGALVRQLGRMTASGALAPMSELSQYVAKRITDADAIRKARLHPISILAALATYAKGQGARGRLSWAPVREIVDALDSAFYLAFPNIPVTGKRTMLALDVSGSMTWEELAKVPGLYPREGAAAMALVQAASGDPYMITTFSAGRGGHSGFASRARLDAGDGIEEVAISPKQRLDDVVRTINGMYASYTDCSLPMVYATERDLQIDTFVVYTDSETNAMGNIQPAQALEQYRQKTGIPARLVVVGMVANEFTVADPRDAGMLDVVGFDTNAPVLISDFSAGKV